MNGDEGRTRRRVLPSSLGWGFWLKLGVLGLFDALVIFMIPLLVAAASWFLLFTIVAAAIFINWAYLSPRARAMRWLAPGLVFLTLFMVWPIIYTGYVSLTNWATGNTLSKAQAIDNLERRVIRVAGEDVPLALHVFEDPAGDLRFYLVDPEGVVYFGEPRDTRDDPIEDPLDDPEALGMVDETGDGIPDQIGDFRRLTMRDLFAMAGELERLVLDVPERGVAQVQTTSSARLIAAAQRYVYDPETDTLADIQEQMTCVAEVGNFVCPDSRVLDPGWREVIGFSHYAALITNPRIRDPFVRVFTWNVAFAALSVALTFSVGLFLANTLQHHKLRGRTLYRSTLIIPYAIPGFIAVIVWRGLLNQRFGQVNRLIEWFGLEGAPWLLDGTWAKAAVLLVNTWLGFPYMFLITMGALQAIPPDLVDAARSDGAGPWRVFRSVKLPLLLVSIAPLLIGSFAFNFNNFVLIFLLTGGGPPVVGADVPVGHTDILISFTFNLALQSGRGNNFALASAIVVLIFFIVALIAAFSFRFTKRLEDIYGSV